MIIKVQSAFHMLSHSIIRRRRNPNSSFIFWVAQSSNVVHLRSYPLLISDGSGTQNMGFGFWKCPWRNGFLKGKLTKVFLPFLPYLMIFQNGVHVPKVLQNSEKHQIWCQKIGKKWRKSFFKLALNPFLADSEYLYLIRH